MADPASRIPMAEMDRDQGPADRITQPAEEVVTVVAAQVSALESLALTLESAIVENLNEMTPIPNDTILTLQRIDYMRQSLSDVSRILATLAPVLDWHGRRGVTLSDLRAVVDMRSSLEGIGGGWPDDADDGEDILF